MARKISREWIKAGLAGIGALTLLILVLTAFALIFLGKWLHAADQPARVDAMIVLAGAPERAMYAADLFRQGYAPVVYVSRPARERGHRKLEEFGILLPTEEYVNRTILNRRGVADTHIQIFSIGSVSTVDEARAARVALPETTKAIMIVTSPYHARRVKMVFGDVFADSGVAVRVVANPYESFPVRWWTDQDAARQTILELLKIVFYQTGGSFSRRPSSE